MAAHHQPQSSIEPASVDAMLTSGGTTEPSAPPSPHVENSPSRTNFAMSPPPRRASQHTRTLSYTPRRSKQLSLSFPVTPITSNDLTRPTPTSTTAPSFPPVQPELIPSPSPTDPTGYLVALAGQERRVLELKEELAKAESDLAKLKKKWAAQESAKKRAANRHMEHLPSLQTLVAEGGDPKEDVATAIRRSGELDRRKALLSNTSKDSRRKIISGGHARTLSLLSPDRLTYGQPFPAPQAPRENDNANGIPRSITTPDMGFGSHKMSSNRARHSYQSGVTTGAKQIAEDVKAGLWTFLEDLRQATVGDEAVNGTANRSNLDVSRNTPNRRGSKSSVSANEKSKGGQSPRGNTSPRTWDSLTGANAEFFDVPESLWQDDNNPSTLSISPSAMKRRAPKKLSLTPAVDELDDDWSNWDSPTPKSPRWSGSTTLSDPSTPSNGSCDGRAVKIIGESTEDLNTPLKRDDIQWPALDKLTPGNLKQRVSTIMKEWEKSLTPPPVGQNPVSQFPSSVKEKSPCSKPSVATKISNIEGK